MLVQNFLENSAKLFPNKKAVWFKGNWISYSELNNSANSLAYFLSSNSVNRGDRIVILLENSIDYIISYFAILKSGGVVVPLNTETTSASLNYQLKDCGAVCIITNSRYESIIKEALTNTNVKLLISDNFEPLSTVNVYPLQQTYRIDYPSFEIRLISIDLASIVYTSGSTGKPKGVMLTHQNLCDNTYSIVSYLKMSEVDRMMVILPFYYIYGNPLLLTHFCVSGSLILENQFIFPNLILKAINTLTVTGFAGVPSTFLILLQKSNIRKMSFDSLRYITQAGGSMAPSIQKEIAAIFNPAELFIMYGSTEAAPRLTYLDPSMLLQKTGSIGKAIPNVDVFVADENGVPLPHNTTGEIVARGSNIMKGYWNDEVATKQVLRNGLYYTGDLGFVDEDGFIFIVGRLKDMIKVRGNRVSPQEIEEVLLGFPGIVEVAVIGVKDEILGEAIKAFIVTENNELLDIKKIKSHVSNLIAPFKIPKYFEFISTLPKNESGKIMKKQLV